MGKGRLEAFSDGVLAIVITITVLELKVPHGRDLHAVAPLLPLFLSYVLSFVYVGIYWNNHHHLLHTAKHVTGRIMWTNLHLLFWLSLVPLVTGWLGENPMSALPTALYGFVLLMAAIAYTLLQREILRHHAPDSDVVRAFAGDAKGKLSLAGYTLALVLAFVQPLLSYVLFAATAILWFVPDKRAEAALRHAQRHD